MTIAYTQGVVDRAEGRLGESADRLRTAFTIWNISPSNGERRAPRSSLPKWTPTTSSGSRSSVSSIDDRIRCLPNELARSHSHKYPLRLPTRLRPVKNRQPVY